MIKIPTQEDIRWVLLDDEIFERTSADGQRKEVFAKILESMRADFIGGYIENNIASLYIVHEGKMHFMVLKEFRKYARELLEASFNYYGKSVYVVIPTLYKTVINFAKKHGFKEVEIIKNEHLKNGRYYDSIKLERAWDL